MSFRSKGLIIAAVLLAAVLLSAVPLSVFASTDWQSPYGRVLSYLAGSSPSFGSINGEWRVFALARSGRLAYDGEYCADYYSRIEEYVASIGSGKLNSNKATENSRLVIALTSIGRNARDVAGYDVVAPLTEQGFVKRQGPTGAAYALLALNSCNSYGEESTKSAYVDFLLGAELSGGGWSLGSTADPDVTGIVITALAPYSRASSAVNRGINKLSEIQDENGGFSTMGSQTSESCSQVVLALSTAGVDCDADERFIKNGNSAMSALCSYFTGSGFAHSEGGGNNGMASEQAAYALCSYRRMKQGLNALYDMNDVGFVSGTTPTPTLAPTSAPTAEPSPTPSSTPTIIPTPLLSEGPTPVNTSPLTYEPTEAPLPSATPIATEAPTETASETAATGESAPPAHTTEETSPSPAPGNYSEPHDRKLTVAFCIAAALTAAAAACFAVIRIRRKR